VTFRYNSAFFEGIKFGRLDAAAIPFALSKTERCPYVFPMGICIFRWVCLRKRHKKLGKGDHDIALMDSDRELKRNILYSIVCNLRREKDAIAGGLIKDGYFGGQFIVRMRDGKEQHLLLYPI
jgi:urocanate hydratase